MSASIGLLCDLFGEVGAAKGDGEASRLAGTLELIQAAADKVAGCIDAAMHPPFIGARGA